MGEDARVAVIGATGLVGREIVALLAERRFPVAELRAYASERSQGEELDWGDRTLRVERLPRELPPLDVAFLCAPADVADAVANDLVDEGTIVIDLSAASREREDVPLLGPGDGTGGLVAGGGRGLRVAVPDAPTILLASVLRPIGALSPIRRVVATVLVSASSFGSRGVERLARASAALLNAAEPDEEDPESASRAFSNLPEEGIAAGSVARDLRRLLGVAVPIRLGFVRTPTFHGLGASVEVETAEALATERVRERLREAPSILLDDPETAPTGTRDAIGSDGVHVRLSPADAADPAWHRLWAATDNLRQGAALHAVAVAEALLGARGGRA